MSIQYQQQHDKNISSKYLVENIIPSFKQDDEEKEEELDGSWSELPSDLLRLVSVQLFAADFTTFRAICKSWRSSSPINRPILPLLDSPYSQSPCLMSLNNFNLKCRFFHPIRNCSYQIEIPELKGADIRFSSYGWLLLSRKDCSIFFFHPFNRIKIELPSYSYQDAFQTMCFSSPPTSADCFVIGIDDIGRRFGIIRRGEVGWTLCKFSQSFQPYGMSNCNPLLYKGRCYWLGNPGKVGVFDPHEYLRADDRNDYLCKWNYLSFILPEDLHDIVQKSYLVESNGKLLAVFELHDYEPCIYVFSLNLSSIGPRMKWCAEKNMGNKTLYVSSGGSFSESAVVKGMSNKIFVPSVQDNSNIFYSLRTKKYHSFFNDNSSSSSSHGKELWNCTWIKPTCINLDEEFKW